ncbi:DUF3304 domain-containing protein [Massilia consociata]|uniref:DUF3304 domain-containing protein n=1 Tax=Massilia consociata TaxID=760117 RepID=A0ABV6FI91_9BURK
MNVDVSSHAKIKLTREKVIMRWCPAIQSIKRTCTFLVCSAWLFLLPGCEAQTIGVSVHGVNYTKEIFRYGVTNPEIPSSRGAGELIDPFAGGGTTCCVVLPVVWAPNIYLDVETKHWVRKHPQDELSEVAGSYRVKVPQYTNGKPGEIWVIREPDGKISVVSSNLQPDHPKWPGKIKGWPVASLEYRRERWEIFRKHEADGVDLYMRLLADLEASPEKRASEAWENSKENFPAEIEGFSGPDDPRYRVALLKEYEEGLLESKRRLKIVMESKP